MQAVNEIVYDTSVKVLFRSSISFGLYNKRITFIEMY